MAAPIPPSNNTYTFASAPRAVAPQRQKYRDPTETQRTAPANMMYDRRIVRGSTLRQPVNAASTQIQDGELFDFDVEVKPILEVLIGKTLEQSMMEVMEEEELDRLRDHQREFDALRAAELAEVQRMEEQARRREEEKKQRVTEQRQAIEQQKVTAEKIAARAFAHSYLADLVPSVFSSLSQGGFFYDRQEREVESQFMPWLMGEVETQLSESFTARSMLDDILRHVLERSRNQQAAAQEAEATTEPTLALADGDVGESTTDNAEGEATADPVDGEAPEGADNAEGDSAHNPDDSTQDAASTTAADTAEATEEGDGETPADTADAETTEDTAPDAASAEDATTDDVEPREISLADETKA
ncbi:uncharacterized protein MONBRDRAFT_31127 [Monosiga brevicollis MX1]|uniref:Radial spoke protein 3 n=1 Tax=Monosiga brevicollis TaxID=81824 RepID=A9URX4_MONBE|nr:uncharacterized protein MONBRDRAFT_31127 [Monosiga brevicollis MX1]EDQ92002.1 predicted protein [Monosiga brevicollis MX1]|eukprot:XP_001743288.1 hypothetical protein [Monosiga brevicollis MX1]